MGGVCCHLFPFVSQALLKKQYATATKPVEHARGQVYKLGASAESMPCILSSRAITAPCHSVLATGKQWEWGHPTQSLAKRDTCWTCLSRLTEHQQQVPHHRTSLSRCPHRVWKLCMAKTHCNSGRTFTWWAPHATARMLAETAPSFPAAASRGDHLHLSLPGLRKCMHSPCAELSSQPAASRSRGDPTTRLAVSAANRMSRFQTGSLPKPWSNVRVTLGEG
jgi:hypothetical protein